MGKSTDEVMAELEGEGELGEHVSPTGTPPTGGAFNGDLVARIYPHDIDTMQEWSINRLRVHALDMGHTILSLVPEGRERSLALTKLEELVHWGVKGIARHG